MPNTTSIERCIEVLIATFGALAGFALIRFLTLTPPMPLQLSPDFGWITAAMAAVLLRYMLGSAVHLNRTFVERAADDPRNPGGITLILFSKDLAFLVFFGVLAVKITQSSDIVEFIYRALRFVAWGLVWGVVDFFLRWFLLRQRPVFANYHLETSWLVLDTLQLAVTYWILVAVSDSSKAVWLGLSFVAFLFCDISVIISQDIWPRHWRPVPANAPPANTPPG
jgi:hypothetical protein